MCDQVLFIREALAAHNKQRELHGVPPLVHNPELSKTALKWATYLAARNAFRHSDCIFKSNQRMGENLAMKFETGRTRYEGDSVTMAWYDEISYYNFSKPDFDFKTGHFTQVVWKATKEVGFGVAQASDGSFYACANYLPAGNVSGQFENNVLPPKNLQNNKSPSNDVPKQRERNVRPTAPVDSCTKIASNSQAPKTPVKPVEPHNLQKLSIRIPVAQVDQQQLKFIQEALEKHNELRSKHNAPPLIHNQELSKLALLWLKSYVGKNYKQVGLGAVRGENYGTSVAGWQSGERSGRYITEIWYKTGEYYDFKSNTFDDTSAPFTQIIWKNTREAGFAVVKGSNGLYYALANYHPSGNVDSLFLSNVSKIGNNRRK